jgi:hypothetical protein
LSSLGESDKELLNEIQWTFPLVTRPFDSIAKNLIQLLKLLKKIKQSERNWCLRQLSAILILEIGYTSSLVAWKLT